MTPAQRDVFDDVERAEAWLVFVYKCRSSRGIQAAMKETQPLVLIEPGDLDQDPYLLCTPGGTLDLRQGLDSLRPNKPEDLITRQTTLSPSTDAPQPHCVRSKSKTRSSPHSAGFPASSLSLSGSGFAPAAAVGAIFGHGFSPPLRCAGVNRGFDSDFFYAAPQAR